MGEVEAGRILASQKDLHHKLLSKRGAITCPRARDLAAQSLLLLDDAEQCWQFATDWLQTQFDADRVDGGRGNPGDRIYRPAQAESFASRAPISSMRPLQVNNRDPGVRALWGSANPVVYLDIVQEPRFQPALRKALITVGTTSKVAVTLRSGARPFGLLCMDRVVTSRPWTTSQYEDFQNVVRQVLDPILATAETLRGEPSHRRELPLAVYPASMDSTLLARLTPAECKVARLAAAGMSYKEIARQLGRAFSTIDHQLRSIRRKLAVRSHTQLASVLAAQDGATAPANQTAGRESSR